MSSQHLTTGSAQPPKVEDKLRLYSMEYCPFAHRARLVLRAKEIPHDIVNINLINKPEWIFNVHPEGKVPALDTGSKIVVESLDIANFLDEQYPEPSLYPTDPELKQLDKELIQKIGGITSIFTNIILLKESKTPDVWLEEFRPHFQEFDDALKTRGTTFFGGDTPGMVDYMLWPWAERAGTVVLVLGEKLPIQESDFQTLRQWRKSMKKVPAVAGIYHGPEKFYRVVLAKTAGLDLDYDNV